MYDRYSKKLIIRTCTMLELIDACIHVQMYGFSILIALVHVGTRQQMDRLEAFYSQGAYTPFVSSSLPQAADFGSSLPHSEKSQPI